MRKAVWQVLGLFVVTAMLALLAGCGSGGGVGSSRASLALEVSSTTAASGTPITATVTLTSHDGTPVNGLFVRVMSSDNNVIADASGHTDAAGKAVITLPVKTVAAAKTITLAAGADGITQSSAVSVTANGPGLNFSLAQPSLPDAAFTGGGSGIAEIQVSGATITFINGNGNPIVGQSVSLYIDSISNKTPDDQVVFNPVQGTSIIAPPGVFTGVTDNSGNIVVPMTIQTKLPPAPSSGSSKNVITIHWHVETVYDGIVFKQTGSSGQTVTNSN